MLARITKILIITKRRPRFLMIDTCPPASYCALRRCRSKRQRTAPPRMPLPDSRQAMPTEACRPTAPKQIHGPNLHEIYLHISACHIFPPPCCLRWQAHRHAPANVAGTWPCRGQCGMCHRLLWPIVTWAVASRHCGRTTVLSRMSAWNWPRAHTHTHTRAHTHTHEGYYKITAKMCRSSKEGGGGWGWLAWHRTH